MERFVNYGKCHSKGILSLSGKYVTVAVLKEFQKTLLNSEKTLQLSINNVLISTKLGFFKRLPKRNEFVNLRSLIYSVIKVNECKRSAYQLEFVVMFWVKRLIYAWKKEKKEKGTKNNMLQCDDSCVSDWEGMETLFSIWSMVLSSLRHLALMRF